MDTILYLAESILETQPFESPLSIYKFSFYLDKDTDKDCWENLIQREECIEVPVWFTGRISSFDTIVAQRWEYMRTFSGLLWGGASFTSEEIRA